MKDHSIKFIQTLCAIITIIYLVFYFFSIKPYWLEKGPITRVAGTIKNNDTLCLFPYNAGKEVASNYKIFFMCSGYSKIYNIDIGDFILEEGGIDTNFALLSSFRVFPRNKKLEERGIVPIRIEIDDIIEKTSQLKIISWSQEETGVKSFTQ